MDKVRVRKSERGARNQYFQKIRAILMFFVIFIHANYGSSLVADEYVLIFIRTIANTAVPVYFFLSGYFFNKKKCKTDSKGYILDKIKYLFIPLVIWDLVYFLINYDNATFKSLLTFRAGWQLYFIVVLIQLILIAPFILRKWNNKFLKMGALLVTPITLIINRTLQLNFDFSIWLNSFSVFNFLIYYVIGLEFDNIKTAIKRIRKRMHLPHFNIYIYIITLLLVYGYNLLIYHIYDYRDALSQLDFMNMCFSLVTIGAVMKYARNDCQANLLSKIGDRAIGIYFIHLIVLELFKFLLGAWEINDVVKILLYSGLTWFMSYCFIELFSKLTRGRFDRYLGFGM